MQLSDRPTYSPNNNVTFDQASVIYAGRIYGKVGAFSQLTITAMTKNLKWITPISVLPINWTWTT
jgi:hypothetical protein